MRVTSTGHAGFLIETTGGSILCDPWFNPTFFGSWFVFPRNDGLDPTPLSNPDYLYISHFHRDHLDPRFLTEHVSKDATVLLPAYGVDVLEHALRDIGFTRFVRTSNGEVIELDGNLRIGIQSLAGPHIGPMGDSMLAVADPTAVVLDQNDAHPADLDFVRAFGPVDAHLLQYSGAIWYPMVYEIPEEEEFRLIAAKRRRQLDRATTYIEMVGARHVVPSAGPPCFIDEGMMDLNDLPGGRPSIFPDATVFIDHLRSLGHDEAHLTVPGTSLEVGGPGDGTIVHPMPESEVRAIFADKAAYLERYREDMADVIAAEHASWPTDTTDLLAEMTEWLDPILAIAHHTREGVGAPVTMRTDDGLAIVIDMPAGRVRALEPGERTPFEFGMARPLLEAAVRNRTGDWCNELFLSCRFTARRDGPYNEYVYTFFKSLSMDRMRYAEEYYGAQLADDDVEWIELDGWIVESRCPHQKASLARMGSVCDGRLTCGLHGWEFDLATGTGTNSEGLTLRVRGRVDHPDADPVETAGSEPSESLSGVRGGEQT